MAELNLPNIRKGGDITFRVSLEDGGVAVDWSALEEKRAFLYNDGQRLVSGECTVAVDPEDSTVLVCQYSGDDRQYLGVNSVVVRAKYRGRLKVYDKKAVNIVGRTSSASGVVVIEDPVVPVQINVEEVSTSLLNNAIDAAINAAAEAENAIEDVRDEETAIQAAEAARVLAEQGRVSAEQSRVAQASADHTLAGQDHTRAESDHGTASDDHTLAVSDHGVASGDHTTALGDHSLAESDHTRAESDHGVAGSDHTIAQGDHTQAGSDHSTAVADHTQAGADHTVAGQDHTQAGTDHNTAASDHTQAGLDHTQAGEDHTQALADHQVMAGYDDRLDAVEGEVDQLEAKVDDLSTGKYYGYFATSADLPDDATVDGFAYVGQNSPYTIYNLRGGVWTSSGVTVNQSPIGNEEDIDQNEDGKLQFANRVYGVNTTGMGYKILRQDATFASQVTDTNTIYEIRYEFNLNGATVTIPDGCVLKFAGGKINNARIVGNNTSIEADAVQIFSSAIWKYRGYDLNGYFGIAEKAIGYDVEIGGTWKMDSVKKEWFGLGEDNSERDCCHILSNMLALQSGKTVKSFPTAIYGLYNFLTLSGDFDGNGSVFMPCSFDDIYDSTISLPSGATALNSTNYPKGLRGQYGYVRCGSSMVNDITLKNFTIDGRNITTSDLPFVNWGVYGLYYSQLHTTTKVVLKDIVFQNSIQCCCFPAIQGIDVFENCTFVSCGEHCVYTRQLSGELNIKNCIFESWGNINGYSNVGGKDCHAIKYQSASERTEDISLTIDGCKFVKGNGLSAYVVNIFTDIVKIYNSEFEISYGCLSNDKDNANSIVDIRNCKYPPCNNRTVNATLPISKIEIRDSVCSSMNCIDAVLFENCTIDKISYTPTTDFRKFGIPSLLSDIQKCRFLNCRINMSCGDSTGRFLVYGTTETIFQDTEFYVEDVSKPVCGMIFSKLDNPSCTVTFDNCYCNRGKQLLGIQGTTCDFVLNNSRFRGSKSAPYGYVSRAPIFNTAKSIKINNTFCEADPTGFIAPLYINTITDVTYISLTLGTSSDYYGSFKGQMKYDGSLNKYVFWNGTAWVNMDGTALS